MNDVSTWVWGVCEVNVGVIPPVVVAAFQCAAGQAEVAFCCH